jgi:hypothetical protein
VRTDGIDAVQFGRIRNGAGGYENARIRGISKKAARVGYRFDVPSWYLDQAPVVTPFSTLYEWTKLSFVVDWIVPMGNYIGALESAQFSPFFKEGWETRYIQETINDVQYGGSNRSGSLSVKGELIEGTMQRVKVNVYPSSILTMPALNPIPTWPKAAVAFSLLTQAIQRWY